MRRLKEIEDRFKKLIDAIVEARVKQAMVPMGSGVQQDPIQLALAHSSSVVVLRINPARRRRGECTSSGG
jgi:molybdopterin-biosynthesis enzyme MoeA-like protein